ncbi:MAG TPA: AAA family ATPase, partial [Fimbriimonadaceae bacterium]|nr:AAA family ATPase [Fimbriimonadaceae bacterium]
MLTKLTIHNFKTFGHAEIELGDAVVFVGPNNAGKTTALQALSLWDVARRRWLSKRRAGSTAQSRVGVTVNRRDLLTVPVPSGRLLWHDLNVRTVSRDSAGKQDTRNVLMELTVDGVEGGASWTCGLEFDYANEESFYVRPRRIEGPETQGRMEVPVQAHHVKMAYLPPMSGLAAEEFVKQPGETAYLIGQGQTAQVLRNICYRVCYPGGDTARPSAAWMQIVERLNQVFGVKLDLPKLQEARSEITMGYRERGSGANLDITAAGR